MDKIEIVPYDERWPVEFEAIAAHMRQGLGDLAVRIDHVGSTSVPGLPAKDIIDIQISVAALDERLVSAMTALGYALREGFDRDDPVPGAPVIAGEWQKLLFHAPPGERRMNIHVRVPGRANWRFALLFRDYLRCHPDAAASYAELKRLLAEHLADARVYPDVKEPAVHLIYQAAEAWAVATGWTPEG